MEVAKGRPEDTFSIPGAAKSALNRRSKGAYGKRRGRQTRPRRRLWRARGGQERPGSKGSQEGPGEYFLRGAFLAPNLAPFLSQVRSFFH